MTDITPGQNGGVIKVLVQEGEGDFPLPGSCIEIHYNIFKTNGTFIESKCNWNYKFRLNNCENVTWNMCISTMKKGQWASFVCHPEYTLIENQGIRFPNETVILTVVILSWKGEDLSPFHDGGIERYHTLNFGRPNSTPQNGGFVVVYLKGQYEDNIFDERNVSFIIQADECSEVNVIEGIGLALIEFNEGETSRLKIKPEYAFGTEGCTECGIPPNATVDYTVTLKYVEDLHTLSSEKLIQQVEIFDQRATVYFENGKDELALSYYLKICEYLKKIIDLQDDLSERCNDVLLTACLKICLLSLKFKHYLIAVNAANDVLKIDSKNVEAFLLRGKAHLGLCKPELAAEDFKRVLELDPTNEEAQMRLINSEQEMH